MSTARSHNDWYALVLGDDAAARHVLPHSLESLGARVLRVGAAAAALEVVEQRHVDIVFVNVADCPDTWLTVMSEMQRLRPGVSVVVIGPADAIRLSVQALKRGAAEYLAKPYGADAVHVCAVNVLDERRASRPGPLAPMTDENGMETSTATQSAVVAALNEDVKKAAALSSHILLCGESGTGKNVTAALIHRLSPRAAKPMVSVNCPDLTEHLMSSKLFGHVRGAFTGSVGERKGKLREAHMGTLFLDEVGELNEEAQARLLRATSDGSYERVGDDAELHADVRIIGATNRDIESEVRQKRFRQDLYYRLGTITLTLVPLRLRREDVLTLARTYLRLGEQKEKRQGFAFSSAAEHAMLAHPWPGNLRQLQHAVTCAIIMGRKSLIEPVDLGLVPRAKASTECPAEPGELQPLAVVERKHVQRVILATKSLAEAAKVLGISRAKLHRKRVEYGLM